MPQRSSPRAVVGLSTGSTRLLLEIQVDVHCRLMPTNKAGPKAVILFAEHIPEIVKVLTRLLDRRGYRVLSASNGERAVQLAIDFKGEIALLLADSSLPDMTVCELVR